MHFLELRIPPVLLTILFAFIMAVIPYFVPVNLDTPTRPVLGAALALSGAAVAIAGVIAFRRHATTVNPLTPEKSSSLVATGIYRFSRNPMYLGFLLALAGWSAFLANWAAVLLLPAFIAYMNRFQIQVEERALRERFGQQFIAYSQSVRRWL